MAKSLNTLVFVYGTLKRGFTNYDDYLKPCVELGKAEFLGTAITAQTAFGLVLRLERKVPCMYRNSDPVKGYSVPGEVFRVDDDALKALDVLEGVSSGNYYREEIEIELVTPVDETLSIDGRSFNIGQRIKCHAYIKKLSDDIDQEENVPEYTEEHHYYYKLYKRPRDLTILKWIYGDEIANSVQEQLDAGVPFEVAWTEIMAGIKFLNLKGWHPSNARNQKRIWIAEQQAKEKAQREQDAATEVRKHAEVQQFQRMAAARGDTESARRLNQQQVDFMYAPPPGLQKTDEATNHVATDDEAVREFRRKMERRSATSDDSSTGQRPLERYVGRRPDSNLTVSEQVERFPFLKDAPVEGEYTASVQVNFKPMGKQVRNVRCLRCSEWGHQSGDRECSLRNFNPHDAARQAMEDPMTFMSTLNAEKKQDLVLKRAAMTLEMMEGVKQDGDGQIYELLLSEGEESSDPEKEFLASLSSREKRLLLKKLKQQGKKSKKSGRKCSSSSDSGDSDDERRQSKRRSRKHQSSRCKRDPRHQSSLEYTQVTSSSKDDEYRNRNKVGQDERRHRRRRSRSSNRSEDRKRHRQHNGH